MSVNKNGPQTQSDNSRESSAQRIENLVPTRHNRNILEVSLEKDSGGAFIVSYSECARLLGKLGLDLQTLLRTTLCQKVSADMMYCN